MRRRKSYSCLLCAEFWHGLHGNPQRFCCLCSCYRVKRYCCHPAVSPAAYWTATAGIAASPWRRCSCSPILPAAAPPLPYRLCLLECCCSPILLPAPPHILLPPQAGKQDSNKLAWGTIWDMSALPAGMLLQPHPACLPPGWRPCVCAPPHVLLPPHAWEARLLQ